MLSEPPDCAPASETGPAVAVEAIPPWVLQPRSRVGPAVLSPWVLLPLSPPGGASASPPRDGGLHHLPGGSEPRPARLTPEHLLTTSSPG